MTLTRYGRREWLAMTVLAVVLAGVAAWVSWWWVVGGVVVVWLAAVSFFRDPWRRVPTELAPGTMLSPADGTVSKVFRVEHHDATGGPAVVVRIFLSVLNVHVNRSPFDGVVVAVAHTPGKYLDARLEESARVNESNLVTLRVEIGRGMDPPAAAPEVARTSETIGVRQVSGAIARRIVCPLRPGDRLRRGQRFGMIKFGSTTELLLPRPDDVDVRVCEGDRVRGGLTILAVVRAPNGSTSVAR